MKNLVLIGFMGTGKSTVGRRVARRLGRPFIDVDQRIIEREGRSISDIFRERGEAYFRDVEAIVIAEAAAEHGAIIATGGGATLRAQNVERLQAGGLLVCLHADAASIAKRVGRRADRPLLAGEGDLRSRIDALLVQRAPAYACANVTIETAGRSMDAIVSDVLRCAKRLA